jgi:hypothetical protein
MSISRLFLAASILLLPLANLAFADEPACREESLVSFFSEGKEVESRLIGNDDPCDQFGGNLVYTPKTNRYLYVNFNIPGTINLDQIDAAFLKIPADSDKLPWISNVKLAVVTQEWLKRVQNTNKEAVLNLGGDTLFVSEVVVKEGRLGPLMEDFYGMAR